MNKYILYIYNMAYKIYYHIGGLLYNNKDIVCIYPLAPKDILKNFTSNELVVCVSNNPKYSVEYYNLPNNSIIYCSFYESKNLTKEVFDFLKEKQIKVICVCGRINNINLIGNFHNINNSFDLSGYDISIIDDDTINFIDSELRTANYMYQPSTGFTMLMDVISQNPKKIYIFGYSFFISKFSIKNNYKSVTDITTHSFKKEFKILKKHLQKENVIKDDMLNYVLTHEDEIPGRD
jgi:hypothetical protein